MTINKDQQREEFCLRLNAVLDKKGAPSRGRPKWLQAKWAESYTEKLSEKTFYKWVSGHAVPTRGRIERLSLLLGEDSLLLKAGEAASKIYGARPINSDARRSLTQQEMEHLFDCMVRASEDLEMFSAKPDFKEIIKVGILTFNKRLSRGINSEPMSDELSEQMQRKTS